MQLSTRLFITAASLCVAMTGIVLGNLLLYMMIGEINRKREEPDLVSHFGFTLPKYLRILSEYRRLYPTGRLYSLNLIAICLVFAGVITGIVFFIALA